MKKILTVCAVLGLCGCDSEYQHARKNFENIMQQSCMDIYTNFPYYERQAVCRCSTKKRMEVVPDHIIWKSYRGERWHDDQFVNDIIRTGKECGLF